MIKKNRYIEFTKKSKKFQKTNPLSLTLIHPLPDVRDEFVT